MKAWYDDINGITASVQTLDGFNKLLNARRQAGYSKGEKLDEFIVLGLWRLDSCGNALKANEAGGSSTPKKAFASIGMEAPLVIRCPDFLEFLKENFPKDSNEASMPFSYEKALPDARLVCSECGKPWTIANCDDVIIRGSQEDINLSGFVGRRLGDCAKSNQ